MNQVMNFFIVNKKTILSIVILLLIIGIFFLLKKIAAKRHHQKEVEQAAADRVRDENLNRVILNNSGDRKNLKEVYVPYDVDYRAGEKSKNNEVDDLVSSSGKQIMVQLIEKTELSTRKFALNASKRIRIGSDLQKNDITVLEGGISLCHCEIFTSNGKVYVRNIGNDNKTIIKRKKEKALVDGKGIRLLSGDTIILGKVTYDITIID